MVILTFLSTHYALAAEKVLREFSVPYELLPTPRAITAHCGVSLRISLCDYARTQDYLNSAGVAIAYAYMKKEEGTEYRLLAAKERGH